MQLGFSTWAMPHLPIDKTIDHLAALGYDAIEITVLPGYTTALADLETSERRRIANLLQARQLTLSAIMAYLSLATDDAEAHARNSSFLQGAIDLAADWAEINRPNNMSPVLITGIGGKPGQLDALLPILVERLAHLGDAAQAAGVVIALEPHIGTAIETPDEALRLMAQVDSPAIRFNFDISHFNILGIPIAESVTKMLPVSAHTHIKDERGRAPNHEFVVPGEGEFDYVAYLKEMAAHGYDGTISVEISKMVQQRAGYDALVAATQSYQVVNQAFVDAGVER